MGGGAGPTLGGGPSEEVTEREAGPWHAAPPHGRGKRLFVPFTFIRHFVPVPRATPASL